MKKILLAFILIVFISCSHSVVVLVPPAVDLIPYERIGLITFSIENAKGALDEMATQRFLQEITWSQKGIQVIELGKINDVLGKISKKTLDLDTIKAIGEHFNVTSFFYGQIKVSDVKPHIDIAALISGLRVRASFNIALTARLFSTETGATLWTDSVYRKGSLADMSIGQDRIPYFDVRDQEEAYRELTEGLIYELTRDFRPTKQRVRKS